MCIANFTMTMSFYLLMPILPFFLRDHFGMSGGEIGMAIAIYVFGSLVARPVTGYALDRWGRRGLFLAAFFIFALTAAAYPFLKTAAALFVVRFIHGIFWGSALTSGQTLAVDITPRERRGEGIGFFTFGMSLAMAIGPAVGLKIFNSFSAPTPFFVSTGIALAGACLAFRVRAPHHTPRSLPLTWDNFLEPRVMPVALAAFMFTLTYGGLTNFIAVYVEQAKDPALDTMMFYIMLSTGTSISRLFGGRLFDRKGPRGGAVLAYLLMVGGFVGFWATALPMPGALRTVLFCASALAVGTGCGFCMPIFQAMVTLMVPMTRQGVANATYATVFEFGIASGIAVTGLLTEYFSFPAIYMGSAVWSVLCALVFFRSVADRYDRARMSVKEA